MQRLLLYLMIIVSVGIISGHHVAANTDAGDVTLPLPDRLQLWLRADRGIVSESGFVLRWDDQSGRGRTAVAEPGIAPTISHVTANGQPAVRFDGSGSFLKVAHAPGLDAQNGFTVFVVYRYENGFRLAQKKDASSGAQGNAWFLSTTGGLGVSGSFHRSILFEHSRLHLQTNVFDGSTGLLDIFANGTHVGRMTHAVSQRPNADDLHLGKRNLTGNEAALLGDIAEMIIYDTALDPTNRHRVEAYLLEKYSLAETRRMSSTLMISGEPIRVGTVDGMGPLAAGLTTHPLGTAYLTGGEQPDLFVTAGDSSARPGVYLYPWRVTATGGAPVFGEPVAVQVECGSRQGVIYQVPDGQVYGLWVTDTHLVYSIYMKQSRLFKTVSQMPLPLVPGLRKGPLAVHVRDDGSLRVVMGAYVGGQGPAGDNRSTGYRPYDAAGIWTGRFGLSALYAFTILNPAQGTMTSPQLISDSSSASSLHYTALAFMKMDESDNLHLVAGNSMGVLEYYHGGAHDDDVLASKSYVTGPNGVVLRHPYIATTVIPYPNVTTGLHDLIRGGEGALHYYRYQGDALYRNPVFSDPIPILQAEANLFAGTLPVLSTIDWDGDGTLDIVAGNSEGRVLVFRNIGSNERPSFAPGEPLRAGETEIHVQAGYVGSIQGPGEARWGYTAPTAFDWNGDGLPDILMGDITGRQVVFINVGTPNEPKLAAAMPLYVDGLNLHGTWRVQPAVGRMGSRTAYLTLDGDDQLHLYWRLDDYNLIDGGKIRMPTGEAISGNAYAAGGTGRLKLSLVDWDGDGLLDLLIGTHRQGSVPNSATGLPNALKERAATVLLLRNVGNDEHPVFEYPRFVAYKGYPIFLGQHAAGPTLAPFDPDRPDLIVGAEWGELLYFSGEDLTLIDVAFPRIIWPIGTFPPVSRTLIPEIMVTPGYAAFESVRIFVDDDVAYVGAQLPADLKIDTTLLSDGLHDLSVEIVIPSGLRTVASVQFRVAN